MIYIKADRSDYTIPLGKIRFGEWFMYAGDFFVRLEGETHNIKVLHVSLKESVALKPDTPVIPIPDKNINISIKLE